jgi:hypothetical protein
MIYDELRLLVAVRRGVKMLRLLLMPILFASSDLAADQACVILKHASTSRQIFVSGANWQYVAGDFPSGLSWKSNVTDRYVRKIKEKGGKVVIVPQNYSAADLEDARKQCAEPKPESTK